MAEGKRMEKVDMSKEFAKLSEADKYFVRKLEQMNRDRAKDMKHLRRKNWFTALAIGTGVLSICILFTSQGHSLTYVHTGIVEFMSQFLFCTFHFQAMRVSFEQYFEGGQ